MRWLVFIVGGFVILVAAVAVIGALLPRAHTASRTLGLKRLPTDVWPVVVRVAQASSVPVDILESDAPNRLVTRVTQSEKNFGGTWTITIVSAPGGSDVTVVEDGWVANPIFRFASRLVIGHHATMDGLLKEVAKSLNEEASLRGQ